LSGEVHLQDTQYTTRFPVSIDREVAAFKRRLIRLCADREWKQKELAGAVGASQQSVSPWLDPAKPDIPKGRLMLALPKALGVSGHWLLTGEPPETPPGAPEAEVYEQGRVRGWAEAVDALRAAHAATVTGATQEEVVAFARRMIDPGDTPAAGQPPAPPPGDAETV
jgi:transcriptional regulator with XRE-family HTH domain